MTETLLVGTDGSDAAARALEFAAGRAETTGESLLIVYVIEWSPYTFNTPSENEMRHQRREEEISRACDEIVNPLVERYRARGLEVRGEVRHGHAANTLSDMSREHDVKIIFIGRKGTSKLSSLLFGSVSGTLIQVSDRPVTVVP